MDFCRTHDTGTVCMYLHLASQGDCRVIDAEEHDRGLACVRFKRVR